MANRIVWVDVSGLSDALQSILEEYHSDVLDGVNRASESTAKQLVKLTKATAPRNRPKFYKQITYSEAGTFVGKFAGKKYVWHVKSPDYRLTHLLVHGHWSRAGNWVNGNPFLHNAVDEVAKDYEAKLVEAIENGG